MFHPSRRKRSAATSASPALLPFPANTMHLPGLRKNRVIACATPVPALSISASTSTPRAKAASSAARICAEVKIGRFIIPPDFLKMFLLLSRQISMSFSSAACSFCVIAWSGCSLISQLWFDRYTVATECFHPSPLALSSAHLPPCCGHGLPLQFLLRAFDGKKRFAPTLLRSG